MTTPAHWNAKTAWSAPVIESLMRATSDYVRSTGNACRDEPATSAMVALVDQSHRVLRLELDRCNGIRRGGKATWTDEDSEAADGVRADARKVIRAAVETLFPRDRYSWTIELEGDPRGAMVRVHWLERSGQKKGSLIV